MKIELVAVDSSEKEILRNLLEKYDYEFSQYDNRDVNQLGLYGYDYLDYYWTGKDRWAFFIHVNKKLAGFVMVNSYQSTKDTDYIASSLSCTSIAVVVWKIHLPRFDMFKGNGN